MTRGVLEARPGGASNRLARGWGGVSRDRRPAEPQARGVRFNAMAGLNVGVVGAGGVGVAAASALIMRGLASRVTVYGRDGGAAHGLALDFMHARPLLAHIEVRGQGLDEIDHEDILIF